MNPKSFPKTITLQLPEALRRGLETIASREAHADDGELLLVVLSRGIVATLAPDGGETGEGRSRQPLAARAEVRPFPRPSVLYKRKQRKQWEQAEADAGFAMAPEQDGTEAQRPGSSPRVEGHLPVRIPDEVRNSLEEWLQAHPEVNEEEAITVLLQRGLDGGELAGRTPREKKVAQMLHLAERLYARSMKRCR